MKLARMSKLDGMENFPRLIIENNEELIKWGELRTQKAINSMCYVCTKYINSGETVGDTVDLYKVSEKYSSDGMVKYTAFKTPDLLSWESVLRHELAEQYRLMFDILDEGKVIAVNQQGGYYPMNRETELYDIKELSDDDLKEWLPNGMIPDKKDPVERYFCYGKDKHIYYDNISNHDIILRNNGFSEKELDTAYKFIYYPENMSHTHTMWNAYGIAGLRESVVYDVADRPFELESSDLTSIENYIKENFE